MTVPSDGLRPAAGYVKAIEAERDRYREALKGLLTFCRECCDEHADVLYADGTDPLPEIRPAEFVLWGKLFPPEALGPRCYDHAAKHIGAANMGRLDGWAVVDLRPVRAALDQKQPRGEELMTDRRSGREAHSIFEIAHDLGQAMMEPMPAQEHPSACPEGFREIDLGMSNCDHSIDEGFEEALRAGGVYGRHAGWNFNGLVWFDAESGEFKQEVWQYHVPQRVYSASTLRELMDVVNDDWGWD